MKKVSLVIPNFNQAAYLPGCFDHCWFQTYPYIELIIVDGGSTDGTKDYLRQLEHEIATKQCSPVTHMDNNGNVIKKTCRSYHEDTHINHPQREIKIISSQDDLGRTGTYNTGFREATGEFCTYIVGDDLPHPHMIETLVETLENTGADVVYSNFNIITDDDRILRMVRKPSYAYKTCFADWFHLGVSTLTKTDILRSVDFMDEQFNVANDYAMYLSIAETGAKFIHVDKFLYSVRFHGAESLLEESCELALRARQNLHIII